MSAPQQRHVIFSADDFGMSIEVNEGIERAYHEGVLTTTSLMVAAPAIEDALKRARTMPDLRIGLHLVVIEGDSVLRLPAITDIKGWFGCDQLRLGVQYFFSPSAHSALKQEITAQFEAFRKTGLRLDHANAHKHMHLHPTIGHLLLQIGKDYGLQAVRTPSEPVQILGEGPPTLSEKTLYYWTRLLRSQIRHAGMKTNDHCFGLKWSGQMTAEKIRHLLPALPPGLSEIYFHPATAQNRQMAELMPGYHQEGELEALCAASTKDTIEKAGLRSVGWADL